MKLRTLLVIAAVVVLLTSVSSAAASPFHRQTCSTKQTPRTELRCAQRNKNHALGKIVWAKQQQRRVTLASYDALSSLRLASMLDGNRWLYRLSQSRIVEAKARIAASLRPAHYDLWMCIHRSEGAWYSTNPNGHYNGLQMTVDWGEGIVGNPNNYTPMQILWAAERGYQHAKEQGRVTSWLRGQWGQTIGPCWTYAA